MKVLFVCTQNIFRSLSAEKLLKLYLEKQKNTNIIVSSAGSEAEPGVPYSYTLKILDELGIKKFTHSQQKLSQVLVDQQNIIICMTHEHQAIVRDRFGAKSFLFCELAFGQKKDLEDDIETQTSDSDLEQFVVSTVKRIFEGIPTIYEKLLKKLN